MSPPSPQWGPSPCEGFPHPPGVGPAQVRQPQLLLGQLGVTGSGGRARHTCPWTGALSLWWGTRTHESPGHPEPCRGCRRVRKGGEAGPPPLGILIRPLPQVGVTPGCCIESPSPSSCLTAASSVPSAVSSSLPLVWGHRGSPGGLMIPPSPQVEDRTEASVAPVPSGCPPGAVDTPAHLSGSCPCSLHLPAPAPPPGLSISGVGMPSPDPEGHLPLLTGTITKLSTKAAGCASQPLVTSVHFC